MAQIRLITDERINVVETITEVKHKIENIQGLASLFIEFTQTINTENYKGDIKRAKEPVFINKNNILMFY